jgi:DNA invertase Pin-like site-specific DNA recombinase
MKRNGLPLVPYMRQSRAKERTISIEEQRRDIQAWARSNGVPLAAEIIEQGVSGSKPWRERDLGDAVDACERGEAAGIIVAWQDRLSRENGRATAEVWEALEKAGARFVAASEGLDTATGDHELTFTIKAAIARDQWKRHQANWETARRNAIEANVFPGRTPTGYKRRKNGQLTPDKRQAAKVLDAFECRRDGMPFSQIALRQGWAHSTTSQILEHEVYLGVIEHGPFRKENAHEPIVSRELFDAVQGTRTTQPIPAGDTTRDRLLLGLARCGGCGRTLKVVRRKRVDGSHSIAYFCKNAASEPCPARAYVKAEGLDALIGGWFEEALREVPRMIDVVSAGRELQEAQVELERLERDRDGYLENADATDPARFRRGLVAREGRVTEARERVQHLAARLTRIPAGGSLSDLWGGFDIDRRRTVLRGFLDRIEVDKGARGQSAEGRLRIFWSDGSIAGDEASIGEVAA